MILHTLNKISAWQTAALALSADDVLLLIEDGVLIGLNLPDQLKNTRVLALSADAQARGVSDRLNPGIELVDYDEFVSLSAEASKVCAWF